MIQFNQRALVYAFLLIFNGFFFTTSNAQTQEIYSFGEDVGAQLMARPNAFIVGAALLFIFALLPGMPKAVLLTIAIGMVFLVYSMSVKKKKAEQAAYLQWAVDSFIISA